MDAFATQRPIFRPVFTHHQRDGDLSLPYQSNQMNEPKPEMTRCGALDAQACVPADWTDEQATAFADMTYPTGLRHGWTMRKQDSPYLAGANERVPCEERTGCVHISFDC